MIHFNQRLYELLSTDLNYLSIYMCSGFFETPCISLKSLKRPKIGVVWPCELRCHGGLQGAIRLDA